jgi:chitodextrinase
MRSMYLFTILLVIVIAVFSATPVTTHAQDAPVLPLDPPTMPTPDAIVNSVCASSTPSSGAYTVTLCFTSPASGVTLTGPSAVSISISVSGKNPGVQHVTYFLNGGYLILAYQSPFSFVLPTSKWQDGVYSISVQALMKDNYTTANQPSLSVTLNNGNSQPPVNHGTFTPSFTTPPPGSPFIVTAAGDGADGATNEINVTNELGSINPNLFLYLGDVYFSGSVSEFYNWYGPGSTFYSKFRSITDPTVGNHEYLTSGAIGYYDYWNNIPPYYSFNAGGWHFISINSNGSKVGGTGTSSPEYTWLAQDLAANSNLCTIAYYHHPLYNIGPEGSATGMSNIWALMAQNGVSIVLNGHDHDYQRWLPLDGSGNLSPSGITEFVVGTGGHGIQTFTKSDNRVAFADDTSPQAYGVLKLSLASSGATFSYINYAGATLDSGFIPCVKAGGDTQAPNVPSGLAATATSATQVNLSWQASADNVGVTGYIIYRDGATLASVSGTTLSYSDTAVSPSTTYSYTVDAFDAAGNHSAQSSPVSVTTPALQDTQPPSVPIGLTATATSATQVNLSWQASADNVGVTGYIIYRDGATLASVSGTTLSYSDIGVIPSTTYSYTVDAFDAAGNLSAQSSPVSVTTPAMPTNMTFTVGADTYINSSNPSTNYGSYIKWYTDGSPILHSLLKFTVSGLNGLTPLHAYLHVYANTGSSAGINVYSISDNNWAENTVNWNTAPAFGTLLGSTAAIKAGSWQTIDVSSFVTGEGIYSFGASTAGPTNISFAARESGVNAAYLVVQLP